MAMLTGWGLEDIQDFDVETFNALLEILLKIEYQDKIEMAYTLQVATQGSSKDLKKWVSQWQKILSGGKSKQKKDSKSQGPGLAEFLKLVGGGM